MNVKNASLNGITNENLYVEQSSGFASHDKTDYVFKLKKALYCLKQAPRAWYKRLCKFLISNNF